MDWLTTSTILEKLHSFEEESAWDLLVSHFRQPLVEIALRMGLTVTDAQDVAQETLLTFARTYRAGSFDTSRGRLRHWLFGIARKEALKARTRARSLAERLGEPAELPGGDVLEQAWEEEWRWAVYQRALRKVEEEVARDTFRVFRMHVSEQCPVAEVCRRLSVSPTQVYNIKHRLTRRIAELVREFQDE